MTMQKSLWSVAWLVVFAMLCLCRVAHSQVLSPVVQHGLSWLTVQSCAGGALVDDVPFLRQRQFEVLTTYYRLGQPLPDALANLALDATPVVTDLLARQIVARQRIGVAVTSEVEQLLLLQNQDGGFGAQHDYPSNVLDTAVALFED